VITRWMTTCTLAFAAGALLAQNSGKPAAANSSAPSSSASRSVRSGQQSGPNGQEVFQQNCARCHNSPEGFPQSISGTVAHHMRVRANQNEEQYRALLQLLNP